MKILDAPHLPKISRLAQAFWAGIAIGLLTMLALANTPLLGGAIMSGDQCLRYVWQTIQNK